MAAQGSPVGFADQDHRESATRRRPPRFAAPQAGKAGGLGGGRLGLTWPVLSARIGFHR